MVWIGLLCLLFVALLSACNDGPAATSTPEPILPATSTPTPSPIPPTSTPEPTPTPSPIPATPTPTPDPTPTPEEPSTPAARDFDIDADTLWGDLFGSFTPAEQSCIRSELGDELLESVLERGVLSEDDTQQWEASIFGCLAPETAAGILFSALVAQMEELTGDEEGCLGDLIADTDVAELVASALPDAGPLGGEVGLEFTSGLLECIPRLILPGLILPGDGPEVPAPSDESFLWRYPTGGWVVNAPTVADGVVYVGSDDNSLYALDASTGELLWSFETGDVIRSSPTVTGGVVYVGSNDNHVYALDAGTGELLWSYDTGDWVQYSPVVSGGVTYLRAYAEGDLRVHALDAMTGEVLWYAEKPHPFTTSDRFAPVVAGDRVYAPGEFGEFYAFDASTGEVAWSFSAGSGAESPPTVSGGVVYLTAVNTAHALDEATGEPLWSYGTERFPARDFPAVVIDGIYYFSPDSHIYALDTATGQPIWSYEADDMINTAPVVAEGVVYVGSESGHFYALDAATGTLVWSLEAVDLALDSLRSSLGTGSTGGPSKEMVLMGGNLVLDSPVVADGVLYTESSDGYLRALDAATGENLFWQFQKGYFSGIRGYTVAEGILYVSALDGNVYAFTTPSGIEREERVLTILYWQAPSLPFPYLSGGTKDQDAGAVTLQPLANYDPDGNLVPALAAQVPTLENGGLSQDLMSITWKLKEGLRWSDGSDMTAEDVAFTWRYCVNEDTGCTAESSFDGITSVQAVDNLTVRITFDAPTPYPYNAFVGAGTPIISRAQFAECIGAAATTCEAQNTAPLGTGPYRIISFKPNERAVYERNPFYWGETPYFDQVVLNGGGDAISSARSVLERGEADYAWNTQVEPEILTGMEAAGLGTVVVAFTSLVERIVVNQTNPDPALGDNRSEYLGGQNPHPFLTFKPIRQAMSMSIDRSRIADELYGFAAKPTCNLVAGPPSYASTANDGCLTQDIAGANKLLDDNGVLDADGDGIREYNGIPLRITYQTSTNAIRQSTQVLIQDWWLQIGIETELVQHDASVFFGSDPVGASYRRFFADVQMYANGTGIDPQQSLSDLLCEHIPTRGNNWAFGNISRSCGPEYDKLYAQLEQTRIGPEREELVKQLNDIYVQSYYEIPLVERGTVSAHANTLQGVRINGWDSEMWNIAEWRR